MPTLALSSLATSVDDRLDNARNVKNYRVVDIPLLVSLEAVAVAPWTVSETELAAFLVSGQPGFVLHKAMYTSNARLT